MEPTAPQKRNGRRALDAPILLEDSFDARLGSRERRGFARQVLLCLLLLVVAVFAGYAAMPDNLAMAAIFEFVKIGALPLATLVVTFYFPSKSR
jgi:uncharacterized RDD family membrane protein YckC